MKTLFHIGFLVCLTVSFKSFGQLDGRYPVRLNVNDASLKEILFYIEAQTGLYFSYNDNIFDFNQKFAVETENEPLVDIVTRLFQPMSIKLVQIDQQIIIVPNKTLIQDNRIIVKGILIDSISKVPLGSATIINNYTGETIQTDNNGVFKLSLTEGEASLQVNYSGFSPSNQTIDVIRDTFIQLQINNLKTIQEVNIKSRPENMVQFIDFKEGSASFSEAAIKRIPNVSGEADVIRAAQLAPGVQTIAGSAAFSVRGSGFDETVVLLDGEKVYNPFHLGGYVSAFQASVVDSVTLHKSAIHPRLSGRTGAYMDVHLKEGNNDSIQGGFSTSLLAASIWADGPIKKDKLHFAVSARYASIDPFLRLGTYLASLTDQDYINSESAYIGDASVKLNYLISNRSKLNVLSYANTGGAGSYTDSRSEINESFVNGQTIKTFDQDITEIKSNVTNVVNKLTYELNLNANQKVVLSTANILHRGRTRDNRYNARINSNKEIESEESSTEFSVYGATENHIKGDHKVSLSKFNLFTSLQWKHNRYLPIENRNISPEVAILTGRSRQPKYEANLFLNRWSLTHNATIFLFGQKLLIDVGSRVQYNSTKKASKSININPRVGFTFSPNNLQSVSINAGITNQEELVQQQVQTVSLFSSWIPALAVTHHLPTKYMIELNYNRQLNEHFSISISGHGSQWENSTLYAGNFDLIDKGVPIQNQFLTNGEKYSYGGDFNLQYNWKHLSGNFTYAYNKSEQRFKGVNSNQFFPTAHDIRHQGSAMVNFELPKRKKRSGERNFTVIYSFHSGRPFSIATSTGSIFLNNEVKYYTTSSSPMNYRFGYNHNIDVLFTVKRHVKRTDRVLSVGISRLLPVRDPISINHSLNHDSFARFRLNQSNNTNVSFTNYVFFIPNINWSILF